MAQLVVVADPLKNSHILAHVRHCELSISYKHVLCLLNPFKPEFTIVIFIHYKPKFWFKNS